MDSQQDARYANFLPGESKWRGRVNKTRQDRMPVGNRERVVNAQRVYSFSQEHKPRRSKDWRGFRAH